jgi:hypothetical protein
VAVVFRAVSEREPDRRIDPNNNRVSVKEAERNYRIAPPAKTGADDHTKDHVW